MLWLRQIRKRVLNLALNTQAEWIYHKERKIGWSLSAFQENSVLEQKTEQWHLSVYFGAQRHRLYKMTCQGECGEQRTLCLSGDTGLSLRPPTPRAYRIQKRRQLQRGYWLVFPHVTKSTTDLFFAYVFRIHLLLWVIRLRTFLKFSKEVKHTYPD